MISKERLDEIIKQRDVSPGAEMTQMAQELSELRRMIANNWECYDDEYGVTECIYCEGSDLNGEPVVHSPDCPVLLYQDYREEEE